MGKINRDADIAYVQLLPGGICFAHGPYDGLHCPHPFEECVKIILRDGPKKDWPKSQVEERICGVKKYVGGRVVAYCILDPGHKVPHKGGALEWPLSEVQPRPQAEAALVDELDSFVRDLFNSLVTYPVPKGLDAYEKDVKFAVARIGHKLRTELAAERTRVERAINALKGILEIGKRDMSNPKYDGYFAEAEEAIRKLGGQ